MRRGASCRRPSEPPAWPASTARSRATGSFGRVVWDESFAIDDEPEAGAKTCEDGAHLPFIALTAAYLARAAQEFLARGEKIGFHVSPAGAVRI